MKLLNLSMEALDNNELKRAGEYILQGIRKFQDASMYRKYADVLHTLALKYESQGDGVSAVKCYKQALLLCPTNSLILNNAGYCLIKQGDYTNAAVCFRKVLEQQPTNRNYLNNLAICLLKMGEMQEAVALFEQVLAITPDDAVCRANWAKVLLRRGDLENGFRENEWRMKKPGLCQKYYHSIFKKQLWQGERFPGKRLLIHSEQGSGDIIQFARYIPMIKKRDEQVVFSTSKELMRLFAKLPGIDEIVEQSDIALRNLSFDLVIPILSLPYIFRTNINSIPQPIPYIEPESNNVDKWKQRIVQNGHLKVGIAWAAKMTDLHSQERSCGLLALAPLLQCKNIDFYSLQKGEGAMQLLRSSQDAIIDYTDSLHDFADTAALIANLDLVITVDTSVAHLAAAMGKRVWMMLRFISDWRWLIEREDSPWYPSMRLFRQTAIGDWAGVIDRIAEELNKVVHCHKDF